MFMVKSSTTSSPKLRAQRRSSPLKQRRLLIVAVVVVALAAPFGIRYLTRPHYNTALSMSLLTAAEQGDTPTVSRLLAQGADPNTAQLSAVSLAERWKMAREIFPHYQKRVGFSHAFKEANNVLRGNGYTALTVAARDGHQETIEVLLRGGADINGNEDGVPLVMAAHLSQWKVVDFLLEQGADPNAANSPGDTALMIAVADGRSSVVRSLLAKGANVNKPNQQGATPLSYAAQGKHPEIVETLLAAGANQDARDSAGKTPAQRATNPRIVALLKQSPSAR
jgi:ankyrin repeat protein